MKKIKVLVIILACLFCNVHLYSQSTYQSSDYAAVNDSFMISTATVAQIMALDFIATGAGMTWDFSSLTPNQQNRKTYIDPEQTSYKTLYLTTCVQNCIAGGGTYMTCAPACNSEWNALTLAEPSNDSMSINNMSVSDMCYFYSNSSTLLEQRARGVTLNSFPIANAYDSYDVILKYPVAYGNQDSSVSSYTMAVPTVQFSYKHWQKRVNNVEGWGTLTTPYGTYSNALKIKSTLFVRDTIQYDSITAQNSLVDTLVEYKWLSADEGYPVLIAYATQSVLTTVINRVEYLDSVRCLSPAAQFIYNPIPAYIDTMTNTVDVNFMNLSTNGDSYNWNFDDSLSGSNTSAQKNPSHQFGAPGLYHVTLVTCNNICQPAECDSVQTMVAVVDSTLLSVNNINTATPLSVYPNPSADFITIEFSNPENSAYKLILTDISGKIISLANHITGSRAMVSTKNLPKGFYQFILTGEKTFHGKLVVE